VTLTGSLRWSVLVQASAVTVLNLMEAMEVRPLLATRRIFLRLYLLSILEELRGSR
jgi:hypothetical protein